MPFKSESQHRKFRVLLAQGKIDKKTFDKWMRETKKKHGKEHPIKPLPERVKKKDMKKESSLLKIARRGGGELDVLGGYKPEPIKTKFKAAFKEVEPFRRKGEQAAAFKMEQKKEAKRAFQQTPLGKAMGKTKTAVQDLGFKARRGYGMGQTMPAGAQEAHDIMRGLKKTSAIDIIKFAAANKRRKRRRTGDAARRASNKAKRHARMISWYPPMHKAAAAKFKKFKVKMPKYKAPKKQASKTPKYKAPKDMKLSPPKPKIPKVSVKAKPPIIKGDVSDLRKLKKHLYTSMT